MIYERMPANYERYIEVFGGGGWVLFGKPPEKCMEVYNDFNSNLANLLTSCYIIIKEHKLIKRKSMMKGGVIDAKEYGKYVGRIQKGDC